MQIASVIAGVLLAVSALIAWRVIPSARGGEELDDHAEQPQDRCESAGQAM